MLYTVKEDLELCEQFSLSPMQLLFMKMYVPDPRKTEGDQVLDSKKLRLRFQSVFFKKLKKAITVSELTDLIARDIIIDNNEPGQVYFDLYELSGKWRQKLKLAVYPMPQELWDRYPVNMNIKGTTIVARNTSPYDISMNYLRAINKDPDEHKKVLDDISWAIENNMMNIGLKKFVDCAYWHTIRAVRKTSVDKGTFNNQNIL